MYTLIIKNNKTARRLTDGHLWIYSNELAELPNIESGSLVKITDKNGFNYGIGFYNKNSLISVRLLLTDEFTNDLLQKRVKESLKLRKQLFPIENSFRLVFGESDLLPGLIIDKYENYFSIQISSAGFELMRNNVIEVIKEIFPDTQGILFRNDSYWRKIEGLELTDSIGFGEIPDEQLINENGIKYLISLTRGQKTGYFFDQRYNRKFLSQISSNKNILDLFTNQGGFALNACKGKANKVLGIDISEDACRMAEKNAELNNYDNVEFCSFDVFDFLKQSIEEKRKWDIIICDPPAFAKNKKSVGNALIAYRKLNKLAMKCLVDNGILLTSSCSQHIDESSFYTEVLKAARESGYILKQIFRGNQSPDHPIHCNMPETNYLKFFGFIVNQDLLKHY